MAKCDAIGRFVRCILDGQHRTFHGAFTAISFRNQVHDTSIDIAIHRSYGELRNIFFLRLYINWIERLHVAVLGATYVNTLPYPSRPRD